MKILKVLSIALLVFSAIALFSEDEAGQASLKLHPVFTDNAVFQRDIPVPVWGAAGPEEKITIEFAGQSKEAVADKDGRWSVKLDPLQASSEPQTMTVSSSKAAESPSLQIKNILVGDVWLCSGQSNMAWQLSNSKDAQKEIEEANYPSIRLFTVARKTAIEPSVEIKGEWEICSPETAGKFSAVGYFFGREIFKKLNVPIGLINSSWGGTVAEAWTTWKTLETTPGLAVITEKFSEQMKKYPETSKSYDEALEKWTSLYDGKKEGEALAEGRKVPRKPALPLAPDGQNAPARLYNGMINPLIPYGIKGVIWYQGESNAGRAQQYNTLLPSLIADWRKSWNQGDFPFLIVQLANFRSAVPAPTESSWAELREAQFMTSKNVPNTGIAVIIDIGEADNIHPKNKQDVGARLALAARKTAYGEKDLVASGPVFDSIKAEDGKIRVKFTEIGGGLEAKGGELKGFAVGGDSQQKDEERIGKGLKFVWAKAAIDGDSVVVWSDEIKSPVAVRYAWADNPEGCNLYNKEGLPAVPFRAELPVEKKTEPAEPAAKDVKEKKSEPEMK